MLSCDCPIVLCLLLVLKFKIVYTVFGELAEGGVLVIPNNIKIYHIVHISKLPTILAERFLVSDAEIHRRRPVGITIGMPKIKARRFSSPLTSHKGLNVGDCVPFYFCPRSPMLYMFSRANHPEIEYRGGQEPIVHLVADLKRTVAWASANKLRWAFTDSNAGSNYFDDYSNLSDLDKVDWNAVNAWQWRGRQDKKQAEFLIENQFPWELVEKIGVYSYKQHSEVCIILSGEINQPQVSIENSWYY
jgi:hypothetical protein